jgi:uncharacterized integral membrane protein
VPAQRDSEGTGSLGRLARLGRRRVGAPAPIGSGAAPGKPGTVSHGVRGTRAAATWAALTAGLVFLVVLLVFILQNLRSVRVHFFWATWTIPLAIDFLLATVLGGLIMFAGGTLRIIQLRRAAKRNAAVADRAVAERAVAERAVAERAVAERPVAERAVDEPSGGRQ